MEEKYQELLEIIKKEVKPALGCTGPVCIAYVTSVAKDAVGGTPKRIHIFLDKETAARNEDVGIPGTEVRGLSMAAAMGAICGDSTAKLEVLRSVTPEGEREAYEFRKNVEIQPDWDCDILGLYVEATVETDKGIGKATLARAHNNITRIEANGKVLFETANSRKTAMDDTVDPIDAFTVDDFFDFAKNVPLEELGIAREAIEMNKKLVELDLAHNKNSFGRAFGKIPGDPGVVGAKSMAASAAYSRMNGEPYPAMSCATSGNVGITTSMAVAGFAKGKGIDEETTLRGLAFCYLMAIYIKHNIGRKSAMCACVVAASSAVAASVVFMLGGTVEQSKQAVANNLVGLFGVVCDGARNACAMKLASAVGSGVECAYLALDNVGVFYNQGTTCADIDETVKLLGHVARHGMLATSRVLSKLMFERAKENE